MMIILITGWSRRGAVRSKTWDSGECGQFTSLPRPPQWIRFYSTRFQSIILYSIQASPPPTPAKTLNCQERECDQLGIFGSTWPTGGSGQFSGNSGADNRLQHCTAQNLNGNCRFVELCVVIKVLQTGTEWNKLLACWTNDGQKLLARKLAKKPAHSRWKKVLLSKKIHFSF